MRTVLFIFCLLSCHCVFGDEQAALLQPPIVSEDKMTKNSAPVEEVKKETTTSAEETISASNATPKNQNDPEKKVTEKSAAQTIAISDNAEAVESRSQSQLEQRALATFGVKIDELTQQLTEVLGKLEVVERHLQDLKQSSAAKKEEQKTLDMKETPEQSSNEKAGDAAKNSDAANAEKNADTTQTSEEEKLKVVLKNLSPEEAFQKARAFITSGDYDKSTIALETFVELHPQHALSQAALYWLGETFYTRKKYAEASKKFAESYQKNDKGDKKADALMKLGMSLARLEKKKEACTTFKKLKSEVPKLTDAQKTLVEKEMKALSCA